MLLSSFARCCAQKLGRRHRVYETRAASFDAALADHMHGFVEALSTSRNNGASTVGYHTRFQHLACLKQLLEDVEGMLQPVAESRNAQLKVGLARMPEQADVVSLYLWVGASAL